MAEPDEIARPCRLLLSDDLLVITGVAAAGRRRLMSDERGPGLTASGPLWKS